MKQKIGSFIAWISTEYNVYFTIYCANIHRISLYFVTLPFIAWISTEYSYVSLPFENLLFVCTLSCLNSIAVYNDQFKYKCMLFFSELEQNINTLCKSIKINEIQHI